ncbi:hypothetical protein DTO271G3_3719 [Paecilomyces variotii]|nr:hypothetical protein DTO271G3_3719 [Paecilomyces variotii]
MPSSLEKQVKDETKPGQTFSSPLRKHTPRPRYPLRLDDLSRDDIHALTKILHIDNTSATAPSVNNRIRNLIDALPPRLKSSFLLRLVPNSILCHAAVCPLHNGMNRHIIHHVWMLIKREVTFHLDIMYAYPNVVGLEEKAILRNLRAVSGMWTPPSSEDSPLGAWDFQTNRCEACMLARIGASPTILRNMRIVLLSRSQMRKGMRAPSLIPWVDAWIAQYGELSTEMFFRSGEKAFAMKRAMNAAVTARYEERKLRRKKGNTFSVVDGAYVDGGSHLRMTRGVKQGNNMGGEMCFPNCQFESLEDEIDSIVELYASLPSGSEPASRQPSMPLQQESPSPKKDGQDRRSSGPHMNLVEKPRDVCLDTTDIDPPKQKVSRRASLDIQRSSSRPTMAAERESTNDFTSEYSKGSWETASIPSDGTSRTTWTFCYRDK